MRTFAFFLPNLAGGGAEKAIINLAEALNEQGYNSRIILLENRANYKTALPIDVIFKEKIKRGFLGKRLAALKLKSLVHKIKKSSKGDFVFISTLPLCDEITHLASIPEATHRIANSLAAEINKISLSSPKKSTKRLNRYKRIYKNKKLVFVSKDLQEETVKTLGLKKSNSVVIYNLFDHHKIFQLAKKACNLPTEKYVIHVGRFNKQKRHDILLSAWQRVNFNGKLVLLTEPNKELSTLINNNNLQEQVIVAGFQANPYPWIKNAEMLVLSSDHEGLPNVIVEALSLGTKVVSTDCPSGPKEILDNLADKCLVSPGDEKALAEKINLNLSSPFELPDHFYEKFDRKKSLKSYLKFL